MLSNILNLKTRPSIGIDLIRILCGGIIFSFGLEILDPEKIAGYTEWLGDVGLPFPRSMAYIGKLSELVFGFTLAVGLFTRFSSLPLMLTMVVINFIMLDGNLRSEPFYLLLLFTSFLFLGSGQLSIDHLIRQKKEGAEA